MNTTNRIKGFTLVEMAIVVIIFGLGLAAFSHVLDLYRKTTAENKTTASIAYVTDYIGTFRQLYGRYPCPASMTDQRDDPTYGRENCTDMSAIAPGGCGANGICIEQSTRAYAHTNPYTNLPVNGMSRIRVGFIPFRQLNLSEDQAYDGYDHRIAYVVTEHLTDSDTFQPNGGGIDIVDDTGGSALENAATAHFLVFSNGANGDGAYTIDGVRTPCAATDAEAQNCELSTDAVYSALQANTEGGDDNYDDVMTFFTEKDLPLWQMSAVANQEDHAHVKNPGKVGFGVDGEAEVRQELQIGDVLRVQDNPDTGPTEGQVKIENLCDYDANNGDCFAPSKIGGQIAQGEGMPCPAGQFLKAIQNSAAVCEDEIIVRCPPGNYMTGIDDDGEPVCNVPPPLGCGQQNVNLTCGADTFTRSIGPSRNGERQTVRAGFSLSRTFECRNGNWIEIGSQSGLCACIPDTTSRRVDTQNCAVPASNCGNRFSGTRDVQSQFQCPAASWANVVIRNGCQCEETFRDTSGSCPAGFNRGSIFYRNTHICTGTPRCSGNVETSRTCACEPDRREERRWCDNGYSGRYWVESFFTCGAGANQPGSWSDWTEKAGETRADRCTCDARQLSDQFADCPEGYEGRIVIKSERICENGVPRVVETRRINECRVIEPMRCKWNDQGSVVSSGRSPKQYMDEQSCNCGVDQPTLCSKAAGNNGYDHYFCSCGQ